MQIPIRMPNERLAGFANSYGHWSVPMERVHTFTPGLIAFNLSGNRLIVNGEVRKEPVLMGVAPKPTVIEYSIEGGGLVSARFRPSALNRLLHIDQALENGVVAMDPDRHPRVAAVYERLRAEPYDDQAWFATLDETLIEMLPEAIPWGLTGNFIDLVDEFGDDISIPEAASRLRCSVRTLERACKVRFGRTPKYILRSSRLHRTLTKDLELEQRIELSSEFSFSDLPHYLNEIRKITGINRAQARDMQNHDNLWPYRYEWPDGKVAE